MKIDKTTKRIGFFVLHDTYEDLESLAKKLDVSISVVCRLALEEYIERNKQATYIELKDSTFTQSNKPINFMATPNMYRDVEALADKSNFKIKTVSSIARTAIAEYIQRNKETIT